MKVSVKWDLKISLYKFKDQNKTDSEGKLFQNIKLT